MGYGLLTVGLGPEEVVEALRGASCAVPEARRKPDGAGLPNEHGVYAWWMSPGAIPGVDGPGHPTEPFELLYVGISPKDSHSQATLRSRICRQHLAGNIGSSTFRQSLAALLYCERGWLTRWSGSRAQLIPEHNRALSDWQQDQLRLTWVKRSRPWEVERRVIALMQPPLNLAENQSHPLHRRLKDLRRKLRDSAE